MPLLILSMKVFEMAEKAMEFLKQTDIVCNSNHIEYIRPGEFTIAECKNGFSKEFPVEQGMSFSYLVEDFGMGIDLWCYLHYEDNQYVFLNAHAYGYSDDVLRYMYSVCAELHLIVDNLFDNYFTIKGEEILDDY